jgi:hypothetical protein
MQKLTKLKKRKTVKINEEAEAFKKIRENKLIFEALTTYLQRRPDLSREEQLKIRATLAVLSHAPLKKFLAFL